MFPVMALFKGAQFIGAAASAAFKVAGFVAKTVYKGAKAVAKVAVKGIKLGAKAIKKVVKTVGKGISAAQKGITSAVTNTAKPQIFAGNANIPKNTQVPNKPVNGADENGFRESHELTGDKND